MTPANGSHPDPGLVTFSWINNGDPDADAVGSWLYALGPWGQTISIEMGAEGFVTSKEISYTVTMFPGQEWIWSVYIYDPNYNSDPHYNFQQPFWNFVVGN